MGGKPRECLGPARCRPEGIDAIVTGHSHLDFPGPKFDGVAGVDNATGTISGKPGVMGGFWGSHLGLIDLMLERDGNTWKIVGHSSEARPIYERVDRKVKALVAGPAGSVWRRHRLIMRPR
jgi:2',3'-cyclic-nucleotide 2'-phosphodiesterase/3'-nucleotidase